MPFALLAPLFLGGLALLAAPWIIHQIRRPERDATRFSSLMFIPHTRKEVIERRRLQHILLMLLRMALLACLALAFTRPYQRVPAAAAEAREGATWHAILLDASYSMDAGGAFAAAKAKAAAVIDDLKPGDRVGAIGFARAASTIAPLFNDAEPRAGSPVAAREALEAAQLTQDTTAYLPALQAAQAMFSTAQGRAQDAPVKLVVHLISDFQRAGLPDKTSRWKLGSQIELRCLEVGQTAAANCAIADVSIREDESGELRVRGKVKNCSPGQPLTRTVKLLANGQERGQTTLTIKPGASRQVAFRLPAATTASLEGRLEIQDDALALDNRRYFAWRAARKRRVTLLADRDANPGRLAARYLASALAPEADLPWQLDVRPPTAATDGFLEGEERPATLIVANVKTITPTAAAAIRRYVETGGRLLLLLDAAAAPEALNDGLLAPWGLRADGPRHTDKRESRFALLSWIDFEHPIFFPLRGPQFNDFSSVRFYNHQRLTVQKPPATPAQPGPQTIASFEPDADDRADPAAVEVRAGQGRAIVWAFGLSPDWSNFPRSVKFIPLLHETLAHLEGGAEQRRDWLVGQPLSAPKRAGSETQLHTVKLPGDADELKLQTAGAARARQAGFARWRNEQTSEDKLVEAINVRTEESDLERVSPEEFQLKCCAPRIERNPATPLDIERGVTVAGFVIQREYWRMLIGLLLTFFILESLLAAKAIL